jgi:two-component system, LytTR family, response regulator
MFNALIVDDERPARSRLIRMLQDHPEINIVGEASNGLEALKLVETHTPNLLFLDIEMPGLSGIEVASSVDDNVNVVFTTAYDQYAIQAFDMNAVDYLLKPIEAGRLKKAIGKITSNFNPMPKSLIQRLYSQLSPRTGSLQIAFRTGQGYKIIKSQEISAIVSQNQYAEVYYSDQKMLVDDSLDALEKKFPIGSRLTRVHRSAIVNLEFIERLDRLGDRKFNVVLNDHFHSTVPISREKLPMVKNLLLI